MHCQQPEASREMLLKTTWILACDSLATEQATPLILKLECSCTARELCMGHFHLRMLSVANS